MDFRTSRQPARVDAIPQPNPLRSPCPDSLEGSGCLAVGPVFQVSRLSWDKEMPLPGPADFVIGACAVQHGRQFLEPATRLKRHTWDHHRATDPISQRQEPSPGSGRTWKLPGMCSHFQVSNSGRPRRSSSSIIPSPEPHRLVCQSTPPAAASRGAAAGPLMEDHLHGEATVPDGPAAQVDFQA